TSVSVGQCTTIVLAPWSRRISSAPSCSRTTEPPSTWSSMSGSASTRTLPLRVEPFSRNPCVTYTSLRLQWQRKLLGMREREVLHRPRQRDEQEAGTVRFRGRELAGFHDDHRVELEALGEPGRDDDDGPVGRDLARFGTHDATVLHGAPELADTGVGGDQRDHCERFRQHDRVPCNQVDEL